MTGQGAIPASHPALLALIYLSVAGCAPFEQFDSWPVAAARPETERLPGRVEALGPFVDVQWKESTAQWGLRPLFSVRQYRRIPPDSKAQFDVPFFAPPATLSTLARRVPPRTRPGEGCSALQVLALWPLYRHESCGPTSRTFFMPLYYNVRGRNEDGGKWHHWALFPIYFGGDSDKCGPYHAVFPHGGVVKNLLGRDKIRFVLFPLYSHATSGEHESYYVLFPFLRWASGGGRCTWQIWPLLGRTKRQDNPPRWFFLWPFFWYTEKPGEGETETRGSAFFPFWGWQERGDVRIYNIAWPLFSHTHNSKTGRTDYVVPWPILRFGSGPDYNRFQVWPLCGWLTDHHVQRQYYLWPLFRFEQRRTERRRMKGRSLFIVYRSIYKQWEDAGRSSPRTSYENVLWPLWCYKRDRLGNTYFGTLALRGVPDPQGWDRFYTFIWRIFEHESRVYNKGPGQNVWRSTRALWEAFRYDRDEDSSSLRLFPLFSCRRRGGRFKSFEVLAGMFGFVDRPGKRTYRTLFIPWAVEKGGDQ